MKIGIAGYTGRVGRLLIQELTSDDQTEVTLSVGYARTPGEENFPVTDDMEQLFARSDAVIDFTQPEGTRKLADLAAKHKKPLIVGTTGLTEDDEKALEDAAQNTVIVYAANMSVGVNMLLALVQQTASRLGPEWDIEVFETHHKHKVDAPSGTALALGKAAQTGRGSGNFVFDRAGQREDGTIGYAVQRGGDVVGEHTVTFFGAGERIELTHKSADRSLYAKGAIRAALWTKDRENGMYSMRDVLGL